MSELFLEQSAQVLDEWEAVRDDAGWSDSMRWRPGAPPRWAEHHTSENQGHALDMVILDETTGWAQDPPTAVITWSTSPDPPVHHYPNTAWIQVSWSSPDAFTIQFRRRRPTKPERRAARREALAMRRRPVLYDQATDMLLLPDGSYIPAETANRNLQAAFDSLDPFAYPQPTSGGAEYHRRRRARASRRR